MADQTPAWALRRIAEEKRVKTGVLDLHWFGLVGIPNELSDMDWLVKLDLSRNQLTTLSGIEGLIQLKSLKLSNTQLTDLTGIENLLQLESLSLSDNQLTDLSGIEKLMQLRSLDLSRNQAIDLSGIEKLSQLKRLYLSGIQLKDLSVVGNLLHLESLDLSNNQLKHLTGIEKFLHVKELSVSENLFSDLSGIGNLLQLESLNMSGNYLLELSGIEKLSQLKKLDLSNNQLKDLSGIENLSQLEDLNPSYNPITDVSPLLALLKRVEKRNIAYSERRRKAGGPKGRARTLPIIIEEIDFTGCPLVNPPYEIAMKGNWAILNYFESIETEGKVPNDQIKLIFLGNSSSGKTSLSRFLTTGVFDPQEITTHGILDTTWHITAPKNGHGTAFQVNVLDFGGQEYYHATHRMFLSSNAVYVVVCTQALDRNATLLTTIYEENEARGKEGSKQVTGKIVPLRHYAYPYWLDTILYYTGAREAQQTVYLVETKCADREENRPLRLDDNVRERYPFRPGEFVQLDTYQAAAFSSGDEEDEAHLYHASFTAWKMRLIRDLRKKVAGSTIPGNYPLVREVLAYYAQLMKNEEVPEYLTHMLRERRVAPPEKFDFILPWIPYDDYESIVRRYTNSPNPDFGNLHTYLQDHCGRILHFPEIDSVKDKVFIDPNWLHQRIYEVLNKGVLEQGGRFTLQHVDEIVEGKEMEAKEMVDIMGAFHLVFPVDENVFIAPQYLPETCPDDKQTLLNSRLEEGEFRHELSVLFPDYLPPATISHYIAYKGSFAVDDIYWKYGLLYEESIADKKIRVFIKCLPEERELQIWFSSLQPDYIRHAATRLFIDFVAGKLDQGKYISLLKPGCEAASYELLRSAYQRGFESVTAGAEKAVIAHLYFPYLPSPKGKFRIFISYSHDREHHEAFNVFIEKFKAFVRYEHIPVEIYSDLDIATGERWREFLSAQVNECDLFVGLLSQSFLNSKFIHEEELGAALRRHNSGKDVGIYLIRFAPFNPDTNISIRASQIFKPDGREFKKETIGSMFSFKDISSENDTADRYMELLARDITPVIKNIWKRKTGL